MSFLTYDTADDVISSLEIIEKLLFPETDFWHDNYLNEALNAERVALAQTGILRLCVFVCKSRDGAYQRNMMCYARTRLYGN